jgi:hypothetical protein
MCLMVATTVEALAFMDADRPVPTSRRYWTTCIAGMSPHFEASARIMQMIEGGACRIK